MDFATFKKRLPNYRKYAVIFAIIWLFGVIVFSLLIFGKARIECEGVLVDQSGNIYVGLMEEIRVFDENGQLLRTISPKTSKGYVFAIEGENLLVDAASTSYVMDLNGTVLELRQYPQLPWQTKTPSTVTANGKIYHINHSRFFYRVTIEENGVKRVAVQMPTFDLLVEIAFFLYGLSTGAFIIVIMRKLLRPSKEELQSANKSDKAQTEAPANVDPAQ